MNTLDFFERNDVDYVTYESGHENWEELKDYLKTKFPSFYVSRSKLARIARQQGKTENEILGELFTPNRPQIQSGDFGEILTYLMIKDKYSNQGIELSGPKKWRFWKRNPDEPAPGTDAVLYSYRSGDEPSNDDILISAESKMKSVQGGNNVSRVQNAIDDAFKDSETRCFKTLQNLKLHYLREGKNNKAEEIDRYLKPDVYGVYGRKTKAFAIISEMCFDDEVEKDVTSHDNIEVILVSIERLKELYESVYSGIS